MTSKAKRALSLGAVLLEDGSFFTGVPIGKQKITSSGEFVFHTAHTGYQEILTDPSYCRQIMTFSAVHIGNQGFHEDDFESARVWAAGVLAKDVLPSIHHWRKQQSLASVLDQFKVPGLSQVPTRDLVLKLRSEGNLWGVISTETADLKALKKSLNSKMQMQGLSLLHEVSTKSKYQWFEGSHSLQHTKPTRHASGLKRVVVFDFGVKRQILRYLVDSGFQEVMVVPSTTTAKEALDHQPDAIFLSNGPGDPAADQSVIAEVKKMIGRLPIFGICLGHQILALALGLQTYKLKFGHRAANHPVLFRDRVEITSQNHGFAVVDDASRLPADLEITHRNLNDHTIEGFYSEERALAGIQFHPEASPGPQDSLSCFEWFQQGLKRSSPLGSQSLKGHRSA